MKHKNNVPSQSSSQWLCGISCMASHAHMMYGLVRLEHSMCRGSIMRAYI